MHSCLSVDTAGWSVLAHHGWRQHACASSPGGPLSPVISSGWGQDAPSKLLRPSSRSAVAHAGASKSWSARPPEQAPLAQPPAPLGVPPVRSESSPVTGSPCASARCRSPAGPGMRGADALAPGPGLQLPPEPAGAASEGGCRLACCSTAGTAAEGAGGRSEGDGHIRASRGTGVPLLLLGARVGSSTYALVLGAGGGSAAAKRTGQAASGASSSISSCATSSMAALFTPSCYLVGAYPSFKLRSFASCSEDTLLACWRERLLHMHADAFA